MFLKLTLLLNELIILVSSISPWPGTQNYSGQSVFNVTPIEGTIAPGKSQDITVTFLPDHESLHYSDILKVELMNKVPQNHPARLT